MEQLLSVLAKTQPRILHTPRTGCAVTLWKKSLSVNLKNQPRKRIDIIKHNTQKRSYHLLFLQLTVKLNGKEETKYSVWEIIYLLWKVNWSTWHEMEQRKKLSRRQELTAWPPEHRWVLSIHWATRTHGQQGHLTKLTYFFLCSTLNWSYSPFDLLHRIRFFSKYLYIHFLIRNLDLSQLGYCAKQTQIWVRGISLYEIAGLMMHHFVVQSGPVHLISSQIYFCQI